MKTIKEIAKTIILVGIAIIVTLFVIAMSLSIKSGVEQKKYIEQVKKELGY